MIPRSTLLAAALLLAASPMAHAQGPQELHSLEDTLAQNFDAARSAAHLRRLSRIPDRTPLRQIVCTVSVTGVPHPDLLQHESEADSALLAVTPSAIHPGTPLPPELQRVAEYNDRSSARGRRITRFSVAAFPSSHVPDQAWVGLALYWSHATEYFAIHFTQSYAPQVLAPLLNQACAPIR